MSQTMTAAQAINDALRVAMRVDAQVICYGLGTDDPKAIFGTTAGLQQEFGARISRLDRIEHALRSGTPLTVLDRTVDLQRYLLQVQPLIQDTVNSLKARLGSHEDARIIVTGGGAALFFKAIKSAFPRNQVIQMVDPLRGNAEGFLIAALGGTQVRPEIGQNLTLLFHAVILSE